MKIKIWMKFNLNIKILYLLLILQLSYINIRTNKQTINYLRELLLTMRAIVLESLNNFVYSIEIFFKLDFNTSYNWGIHVFVVWRNFRWISIELVKFRQKSRQFYIICFHWQSDLLYWCSYKTSHICIIIFRLTLILNSLLLS